MEHFRLDNFFRTAALLIAAVILAKPSEGSENFAVTNFFVKNQYEKQIWSGAFKDLSGTAWNTSELYENKNITWTAKIEFVQNLNDKYFLRHGVMLDSGWKSLAQNISPHISYSLGVLYLSGAHGASFSIGNLLQFGASNTERICYDNFDREYHCGTGLPWTVYTPPSRFLEAKKISLLYVYRF